MELIGIINLFERGISALEKIADAMTSGQSIPGSQALDVHRNWGAQPVPEARQPLDAIDGATGATSDDAAAAEAKKRTRVSQAMREDAKSKAEAAGVLEAAEKEMGPWAKWGSKDCDKAVQMASSAGAPTQAPAEPVAPAMPAPGTSPVNIEDRKARYAALCDALKAKCTPQEGEALVISYTRMICDDNTVTPGRFVSRADFEERLAEFKVKVDATPVNPTIHVAAQASPVAPTLAVEPEVLPPAADSFTPTPENARRIAYLAQFPPTGAKFTQETKDLLIQLLREGKPLGKEDARVFCVAAAAYGRPATEVVIQCIGQAFNPPVEKPSVDMFTEAQVLPFIDSLIAADEAAQKPAGEAF